MKTLPLMYPIIPKRQQRAKGGSGAISGMSGQMDERSAIEYFMAQVANKAISGAESYFAANGEHSFRMMLDPESDEVRAFEH